MLERAKRASHIDPPASSYAIMRRARLTAERTLNPARMFTESLTPGPELENSQGHEPTSLSQGLGYPITDHIERHSPWHGSPATQVRHTVTVEASSSTMSAR
jgi:hypothetical protein